MEPEIDYFDLHLFGQRVKAHREALAMSQSDLADTLGVSRRNISNYETGVSCPTVPRLAALCRALRVSADQLMGLALPGYGPDEYRDLLLIQQMDAPRRAAAETILKALHDFKDVPGD